MTKEQADLIHYRLSRAKETLEEAQIMFDNRLESDYGELVEIEPDEIKQDLATAAEFICLISAMIST